MKDIEELKLNKNNNNNISKNIENETNNENNEEYTIIKHKKKEYIVYKNKIYTKTENNKKGLIVGSYEDGKVNFN